MSLVYIRDIVGRLTWLTQNLDTLVELITGYQEHLRGIYSLEQFYGDNEIKSLVSHTADLVEVLEDYLEMGLEQEVLEEEGSDLLTKEIQDDEKKTEE